MENYLYGWGQLPKEINPRELSHLTYGSVDPVENVKTEATQTAKRATEKAVNAILDLKTIGALFSKYGLGFIIPDAAKDEIEKEKKKKTGINAIIQAWK